MVLNDCNNSTLETYSPNGQNTWNLKRIQHLFRRLGFSISKQNATEFLNANPINLIDDLVNNASNQPITTPPDWAGFTIFDYFENGNLNTELYIEHYLSWVQTWANEMFDFEKAFREKLVLFWSNHFVTVFDEYECLPSMYQYHKLLQENALGNFKEFVRKIGINPAMLIYLNGNTNVNEDTNENYARELFELFTLGENNGYTQTDIEEASRALTGWNTVNCVDVFLNPLDFDNGEKTIFGQTGNWNYDDLIDILFEQRATEIANFICAKFYKFYVSNEVNSEIVATLAETFISNNWSIASVLKQLFKSEHFFDETIIGNKIKSPSELLIGFVNETNITLDESSLNFVPDLLGYLGQRLFNPPNVAGWQENRAWIDNTLLSLRWEVCSLFLGIVIENNLEYLRDFAKSISSSQNDPIVITQDIVDYFLPQGLYGVEEYQTAVVVFKDEVPSNYFNNGYWNLDWEYVPYQVALLLVHISKQPQFQLC